MLEEEELRLVEAPGGRVKRRIDVDRQRRREIRAHVEKALTEGKELHEGRLRDEVVPPLEGVARTMDSRQRKEEA